MIFNTNNFRPDRFLKPVRSVTSAFGFNIMDTKNKFPIQQQLIQKIKELLPANSSLVYELSDLLQVSNDSAYRRIRGETALAMDEAMVLSNHFKISLDAFGNESKSGMVSFNYNSLKNKEDSFENYLKSILKDLKQIQHSQPNQIIFAAEDVPIFHHFNYPLLTAFKLFYWNKSIWGYLKLTT